MGMMQAIRCKFGHHDWGPITGDIEHVRHECEQCTKVKPVKVTPSRGYRSPHAKGIGFYEGGGGGGFDDGGGGGGGN